MNCRDTDRLIDTFFDGELDGRLARDAAMHVTRCKRCESELHGRERLHDLLEETIDSEIADIDAGRLWAGIENRLNSTEESEDAAPTQAGWRLAAASQRVTGIFLGRGRARAARQDPDDPDAEWLLPAGRAGLGRLPIAGLTALAAAAMVALALLPTSRSDKPETIVAGPPAQVAVARSPISPARSANRQVQVDSVSFPHTAGAVAMWSEPATETTVIWIDDEEAGRP